MAEQSVRTLSGRVIPLAPDEANHAGKAAVRVARAFEGREPAGDVAFLLYDELRVEVEPDDALALDMVRAEMGAAAPEDG
jgi:hypothetical protein